MAATFRRTGMLQLYFSCSQVQLGEVHCKNKWPHALCMHIFSCICILNYMDIFGVCAIANLVAVRGGLNMSICIIFFLECLHYDLAMV